MAGSGEETTTPTMGPGPLPPSKDTEATSSSSAVMSSSHHHLPNDGAPHHSKGAPVTPAHGAEHLGARTAESQDSTMASPHVHGQHHATSKQSHGVERSSKNSADTSPTMDVMEDHRGNHATSQHEGRHTSHVDSSHHQGTSEHHDHLASSSRKGEVQSSDYAEHTGESKEQEAHGHAIQVDTPHKEHTPGHEADGGAQKHGEPGTVGDESVATSSSSSNATRKPSSPSSSTRSKRMMTGLAQQDGTLSQSAAGSTIKQRRKKAYNAARKVAKSLLEALTCPQCESPLREPVSLPCGHSACARCVLSTAGVRQSLASNSPSSAYAKAAASSSSASLDTSSTAVPSASAAGAPLSSSPETSSHTATSDRTAASGESGSSKRATQQQASAGTSEKTSLPASAPKSPSSKIASSTPSSSAAKQRNPNDPPALPCSTHVPPRFPLSTSTVPCPVFGCPRSAIGRGLGLWAGHMVRYTAELHPAHQERAPGATEEGEEGAAAQASSGGDGDAETTEGDKGPGVPPVDGFVIGAPEHTVRLSVIPAQKKEESKQYFVNVFGERVEEEYVVPSNYRNALRTDVTLVKVLAVLRNVINEAGGGATGATSKRKTNGNGSTTSSAASSRRIRHQHQQQHLMQLQTQRRKYPSRHASSNVAPAALPSRKKTSGSTCAQRPAHAAAVDGQDIDRTVKATAADDGDDHLMAEDEGGHDDAFEDEDDEEASQPDQKSDAVWPEGAPLGAYTRPRLVKKFSGGAVTAPSTAASISGVAARKASFGARRQKRRRSVAKPIGLPEQHEQEQNGRGSLSPARTADWSDWESDTLRSAEGGHIKCATREKSQGSKRSSSTTPASSVSGGASSSSKDITVEQLHAELLDTLECQLCYNLLYKPLTTPCGHTFCKSCFSRSLDHADRCPLCRSALPAFAFFQEHPCNNALLRVLQADIRIPQDALDTAASAAKPNNAFTFKQLYEARREALEQEEQDAHLSTPIFVCTLAFPGMPTVLHIFEPRYRLMIRRCLESDNPRFGMVLPSRNLDGPIPGLSQYGTMLEIKSVQMLPDGRSMLETVGSFRFRLLEKGSLDGYTVGRIERIDDLSPELEAELEATAMARNANSQSQQPASSETQSESAPTQASEAMSTTVEEQAPAATDEPAVLSSNQESTTEDSARSTIAPSVSTVEAESTTPEPTGGMPGAYSASNDEEGNSAHHEPSTAELVQTCMSFIEELRSGSAPWLLTRLNHTYGPMPEAHEVERLGYWMALIMPIDEHEKAKLLPIRSPRLRLRLVVHWIEQLRQSWWFSSGCSIS